MRLKLDENQPQALLAMFRGAGHDAETAGDEGLAGKADADLAAHCRVARRALLTFDLDFADLRQYPPEQYPGLLVLRLR
jgi:predicted nuclease of predicted toxin-antitoxin system